MVKKLWITPGKEYITTQKAIKNYVCHDSGKPIFKGTYYVKDYINYITPKKYGGVFLKWYCNRIRLDVWRGALP